MTRPSVADAVCFFYLFIFLILNFKDHPPLDGKRKYASLSLSPGKSCKRWLGFLLLFMMICYENLVKRRYGCRDPTGPEVLESSVRYTVHFWSSHMYQQACVSKMSASKRKASRWPCRAGAFWKEIPSATLLGLKTQFCFLDRACRWWRVGVNYAKPLAKVATDRPTIQNLNHLW